MWKTLWYGWRRGHPQRFKPVILVTGCTSGIGLSLARLLSRQTQYRVVITGRAKSLPSLRSRFVEDERFWILELDVTSEQSRVEAIRQIRERWGPVNVLVNNAGVSYRAVIEHMTEEDEHRQMQTNYLGPMGLIRLVLPLMRRKGRGKIINVSSVSGMLAMPTMASYSASKHALEGACEALWYEAKPYGIDVCLIQPGFIRSNSFENVTYTSMSDPASSLKGPYQNYYRHMIPFIGRMMGLSRTPPERISRLILKTIQREDPPLWIPATLDAVIFHHLRRIIPRRWLLPFLFLCLPQAKTWAVEHSKKRVG